MILSKKNIVLFSLIVSTICFVYARVTVNSDMLLIAKPIAVFSVILYYIVATDKINYIYLGAFFVYLVSDLFFLFVGEKGLFIGLMLYFVGSSMVSINIIGKINIFEVNDFLKILLPVTVLVFALIFLFFLDIGVIRLMVLLFSISIGLLLSSSIFYYKKTLKQNALWILVGSFLFLICNLIAGLNRFIEPNPLYRAMASFLYIVSLYCMVRFMTSKDN